MDRGWIQQLIVDMSCISIGTTNSMEMSEFCLQANKQLFLRVGGNNLWHPKRCRVAQIWIFNSRIERAKLDEQRGQNYAHAGHKF